MIYFKYRLDLRLMSVFVLFCLTLISGRSIASTQWEVLDCEWVNDSGGSGSYNNMPGFYTYGYQSCYASGVAAAKRTVAHFYTGEGELEDITCAHLRAVSDEFKVEGSCLEPTVYQAVIPEPVLITVVNNNQPTNSSCSMQSVGGGQGYEMFQITCAEGSATIQKHYSTYGAWTCVSVNSVTPGYYTTGTCSYFTLYRQ